MVIEDMEECTRVVVGVTSLSMHERFTQLAEISPFQRAATLRARRMSTNEGPLFSTNLRATQNQIVDEVVEQLGLDWRVQELQQDNRSRAGSMPRSRAGSLPRSRAGSLPRSRAGSLPRSRAGSMSRNSSESEMPGPVRSYAWGNLSRANSVGNVSQQSGQSGRSSGGHSNHSRAMSFKGPDLNQRLQMRNAWMRRRNAWMRQRNMRARGRGRGRGRGHGGYIQWNQQQQQQRGRWNNPQWRWGWQQGRQQWWPQQRGRQQWGRQQWGRQQQGWGRLRRWGYAQSERPPLTPRGRAGQEYPGYVQKRGGAGRGRGRGRGMGRGRGGLNTGVSQNSMPGLKTKEQLDKELEEYMASTPALLDKELDQYMAQIGLSMDSE